MFRSKLVTLSATQICNGNENRKMNLQKCFDMTPSPTQSGLRGFWLLIEELSLYHGQFHMYFRMSVGHFQALLQTQAHHLKSCSEEQLPK